jgi:hypothetical protein
MRRIILFTGGLLLDYAVSQTARTCSCYFLLVSNLTAHRCKSLKHKALVRVTVNQRLSSDSVSQGGL